MIVPDDQLPVTIPNPDSKGGQALFTGNDIDGTVSLLVWLVRILAFFLITKILSSSVCRADSGKADPIPTTIDYLKSLQLQDRLQKFVAILNPYSILEFIGVEPELIPGARLLSTELLDSRLELSRPDLILQLVDLSCHIVEFQSTANNRDIFRFTRCHNKLAEYLMTEYGGFEFIPPIWVTGVFSASAGFRPSPRYPHKNTSCPERDSFSFTVGQVFLVDFLDIEVAVKKAWAAFESWDGKGTLPLSKLEMLKWHLSALGKIPKDPLKALKAIEDYLEVGRYMAEKAGAPHILFLTICGVLALKNIPADDIIYKFLEGLYKMGISATMFMDAWTNGQYSKDMEEKAALQAKNDALVPIAVRALYAENKSPAEICETLDLEEEEVLRILKGNGNGR